MTRKALLFGFIGLAGMLLSLRSGSFASAAAALALLLFLSVALYRRPAHLSACREGGAGRLLEGDIREVSVTLDNDGARTTGIIEAYDNLSDKLRIARGRNRALRVLPPFGGFRMQYAIEAPLRGFNTVGPVSIREDDVLGFHTSEATLGTGEEIIVNPLVESLNEFEAGTRRNRAYIGGALFPVPGHGTEFYRIRDYIRGDPLRRINWKVVARQRKLMVNEYEKEALRDLVLVLDTREAGLCGTVSRNPIEYAVRGAASLARYFISRSDRVGLLAYGRETLFVPPGNGTMHLEKLTAYLTSLEGGGATPFGDAIRITLPSIGPRTTLVVITGLEYDPTLNPKLIELHASGYPLVLLCPRPFEFEARDTVAGTARYELLRLERENFVDNLKCCGIEVVDWTPDMKLLELIERCECAR